MAFKDLLVHIDDHETCAMRLEAAISIALAQPAQLAGAGQARVLTIHPAGAGETPPMN